MRLRFLIILNFIFVIVYPDYAQPGHIDETFGNEGKVVTSFYPQKSAEISAVLVQPDGKIIVTGYTLTNNGYFSAVVMRYLSDGSPDFAFNGTGKLFLPFGNADTYANDSAMQPDGKILTTVLIESESNDSAAIYRTNPNGSPDTSFNHTGHLLFGFNKKYQSPNKIVVHQDGRISVSGYFGDDSGDPEQIFIFQCLPNGTPNLTYGENGRIHMVFGDQYASAYGMLLQPDDKIILTGFSMINGQDVFTAARRNPDGSGDSAFDDDGILYMPLGALNSRPYSSALLPDGKIILGGYTNFGGGDTEFAVARLTSFGKPDSSFGTNGKTMFHLSAFADEARGMAIQPDGKILLVGYVHSNGPSGGDVALVRLMPDGTQDQSFSQDGIVIYTASNENTDYANCAAIQPDGKIIVGGLVHVGDNNRMLLMRFISGLTVATHEIQNTIMTDINVFPNPTSDAVTITFQNPIPDHILFSLFNSNGILLEKKSSEANTNSVNFSLMNMPSDFYLVELKTTYGSEFVKVLKQ